MAFRVPQIQQMLPWASLYLLSLTICALRVTGIAESAAELFASGVLLCWARMGAAQRHEGTADFPAF